MLEEWFAHTGGEGCLEAVSSLRDERGRVARKSRGITVGKAGGVTSVACSLCAEDVSLCVCRRL